MRTIDAIATRERPTLTLVDRESGATWADIESERRERGLEAGETIADASWGRALAYAARMRDPARKRAALDWVAYCVAPYGSTKRPIGTPRDVVLTLAELGIIDPEGFDYEFEED